MYEGEHRDPGRGGELGGAVAVECPVSTARSASVAGKLASWKSSSAPSAAISVSSQGSVSPVITIVRPGRSGPIT